MRENSVADGVKRRGGEETLRPHFKSQDLVASLDRDLFRETRAIARAYNAPAMHQVFVWLWRPLLSFLDSAASHRMPFKARGQP